MVVRHKVEHDLLHVTDIHTLLFITHFTVYNCTFYLYFSLYL